MQLHLQFGLVIVCFSLSFISLLDDDADDNDDDNDNDDDDNNNDILSPASLSGSGVAPGSSLVTIVSSFLLFLLLKSY